jgi:Ca2+/Na+ antiporter
MAKITNNELKSALRLFILTAGFVITFLNIKWQNLNFLDYLLISILVLLAFILFLYLYSYLKREDNIRNKKVVLSFIRVLMPFLLGLFSLVYVISSGLFNVQRENIKREIYALKQQDSSLQKSILQFKNDSVEIQVKNDSLRQINSTLTQKLTVLNNDLKSFPEIEKNYAQLKIDSSKLSGLISKLQHENRILNQIKTFAVMSDHIKAINNLRLNGDIISFKIRNQFGKLLTDKEIELQIGIYDKQIKDWLYADLIYENELKHFRFVIPSSFKNNKRFGLEMELYHKGINGFSFRNGKNLGLIPIGVFGAHYEILIYSDD